MARQRKHIRRSKKGKPFVAGKKKAPAVDISSKIKKQILEENAQQVAAELKRYKRSRIPKIGVLRLHIKPATRGGKKVEAFGKTYITKPKPRRAVIKFSAAKELKEAVVI